MSVRSILAQLFYVRGHRILKYVQYKDKNRFPLCICRSTNYKRSLHLCSNLSYVFLVWILREEKD